MPVATMIADLSRPLLLSSNTGAPDMLLWVQGCRDYVTQPVKINRAQAKYDTLTHPPRLAHRKCQWESATGLVCSSQSSRVLSACGTFLNGLFESDFVVNCDVPK